MSNRRVLVAMALMSVAACAARQPQPGIIGQGTAFVQARDGAASQDAGTAHPPWALGSGMQLARGSYELALWFDIPRAQIVEWTVTCPGVDVRGTAGETFEHYKARRVEELRAARGHPRVASLSMIPGDEPIELPPGDVGAGRLASTVRVMTGGTGVCAVTATADDASVLGTYQVTRIRDPHLEARARSTSHHAAAIQIRGFVPARQVTYDPARAERELAADLAAAEANLQREADARVQMQLAAHRQTEIDAHREVSIIDVVQRRLDLAQRARADLRRRWVAWGAIPRPPMPAPLVEEPGDPPYPGATWTPGTWQWIDGLWTWRAGSWSSPDVFDRTVVDPTVGVGVGLGFDLDLGGGADRRQEAPRVRDHERTGSPRVREHHEPEPIVRDHPKPEPTVRDHPKSTIRVHENKDEDKGPRVRNHPR